MSGAYANPYHPKSITIGNTWPPGISDGLTLECYYCGRVPSFDYTVSDECWRSIVPEEARTGVVCLPCLESQASAKGLEVAPHLESVQFVGHGYTIVLSPTRIYYWKES